mmetsp:Transcript_11319/g.30276  ORF Transcript_11319/g.30276 Transcript_11319/m.30276 type:complete len:213 (+) Transcript_11319:575-1213(+)
MSANPALLGTSARQALYWPCCRGCSALLSSRKLTSPIAAPKYFSALATSRRFAPWGRTQRCTCTEFKAYALFRGSTTWRLIEQSATSCASAELRNVAPRNTIHGFCENVTCFPPETLNLGILQLSSLQFAFGGKTTRCSNGSSISTSCPMGSHEFFNLLSSVSVWDRLTAESPRTGRSTTSDSHRNRMINKTALRLYKVRGPASEAKYLPRV